MRHLILIMATAIFITSCGQNDTKQKELELKERELALKEKELALKTSDTSNTKLKIVDTVKMATTVEEKPTLPFIGSSNYCIQKNESGATGNAIVTITTDGKLTLIGSVDDHGLNGNRELNFKSQIKQSRARKMFSKTGYEEVVVVSKQKIKWKLTNGPDDDEPEEWTFVLCQ
jgi:hypothetical protein